MNPYQPYYYIPPYINYSYSGYFYPNGPMNFINPMSQIIPSSSQQMQQPQNLMPALAPKSQKDQTQLIQRRPTQAPRKTNKKLKNQLKKKITKQNNNSLQTLNTRNILPNSIHQLLTYVRKRQKSGSLTEHIFQILKHENQWTVNRYYSYQESIKDKFEVHLKKRQLNMLKNIHSYSSAIYSIDQQQFYMKVSRILAKRFINTHILPIVLTSNRINTRLMMSHLTNRRILSSKLLDSS